MKTIFTGVYPHIRPPNSEYCAHTWLVKSPYLMISKTPSDSQKYFIASVLRVYSVVMMYYLMMTPDGHHIPAPGHKHVACSGRHGWRRA